MSGNLQGSDSSYAVNTLLPLPLVVRVVDTMRIGFADDNLGAPISNFPVLFTAYSPSGDGTLNDQPNIEPAGTGRLNAVTDEDGLAAVRWTLGTKIGDPDLMLYNNKVIAVVVFADGSQDSVVFFATGVPQAASKIAATGGTNLVGIAGKPLSGLSVAISDQFDNPNQGIAVSYVVDQSPGPYTFLNPYGVTDIYGFASASINALSTKAGEMKVSAVNGTLTGSPVTFTITVQADDPAEFLPAGGNNQTSTVGTAFTSALKVLVFDKYRNPVPDVRVAFDITAGSASLSDIYVQTDSDGLASTTVTPNAAGAIKITATTDIGSLTFNLSATAEE